MLCTTSHGVLGMHREGFFFFLKKKRFLFSVGWLPQLTKLLVSTWHDLCVCVCVCAYEIATWIAEGRESDMLIVQRAPLQHVY